jgi:hypothetical protein
MSVNPLGRKVEISLTGINFHVNKKTAQNSSFLVDIYHISC